MGRSDKMKRKLYDLMCDISHVVIGGMVALSVFLHWTLPVIGSALFVIYELDEAKKIDDLAYADIREFMFGFFIAMAGLFIWRFIW